MIYANVSDLHPLILIWSSRGPSSGGASLSSGAPMPQIAISPRFCEASPEMTALKAALVAKSYEVFLCDESASG